MNNLQLYRKGVPTVVVPIDESTVYLDELMGRNDVACSFYSEQALDIRVDDYILLNGVQYTINVPYQVMRGADFQYSIIFEHPSYWLKDIVFKHLGAIEFAYYGTPETFIRLIVENMNAEDSGWSVGTCEVLDDINIDFYASGSGYSCLGALQLMAERFDLEYWFSGVNGKTINIAKQAGVETNIHFEYGRSRGLYSVERGVIETPLYNRIIGFGGSNNLKSSYRGGMKRLTFDIGYIERPLSEGERRREKSVVFDDIFPERTGTITGVSADGISITDTTLDFDLNGNRIDGQQAFVVFKSGALSAVGNSNFEIDGYNHSTKTIRIKENIDSSGYKTPNASFYPAVGDKYTLIGIDQPLSYIDNAEKRLKDATKNSFKQLSRPPYRVEIDEKYMRENGFKLRSGDRVHLIDSKLEIDDKIRITSVSFPLVNENQCTVVVSDKITYTREAEIVIDQNKVKEQVKVVDRTKAEQQRIQAMRMRQLQELTFDPDGYFDVEKIKPLSIETMMLSVGAKSQNFYLNGVSFEANAGDDVNRFVASAGQLIHREVEITGLGYIWEIDSFEAANLDPLKHYYLSARCSASSLTGIWYLSEVPLKVDHETGFLHFNVGVLYAVHENKRDTSLTYGMTYFNGANITTGKIAAERIDVSELFALLITVGSDGYSNAGISGLSDNGNSSVRFWAGATAENRNTAPFNVLNDGSMSATKGKIGGFVIDTTTLRSMDVNNGGSNPTNPSSGIILSDLGVLSRNTGMSFLPSSTGLDFSGSIVGEASVNRPSERPFFTANVRAGVIGVRRQDLSSQALDLLQRAWGRYGAMLSSVKFLGAMYEPVRVDNNNTDTYLTEFDYYVAKGGSNSNVFLPSVGVEIGRSVLIKNATGANITVHGNGSDIYKMDNTASGISSIARGSTCKYRYSGSQWLEGFG